GSARVGVGPRAAAGELLRHPTGQVALARRVVAKDVAGLGARLRERGVGLHALADEREHRPGSRASEIAGDRLRVGGAPALDALDDAEPRSPADEADRVAGRGGGAAGGLGRVEDLDRAGPA